MDSGIDRRRPKSERQLTKRSSMTSKLTGILEAARNNDIGQIQTALRNGDDINAQDENGNTALHGAAMFNLYDVISYLIYMGADTKIRNKEGVTVHDICRNEDMRLFLRQTNPMIIRGDYRKINEDVICLALDDTQGLFRSSHVNINCPNLTEGDELTLRCRSVRLEDVAWQFLDVSESACGDNCIICTNKTQTVQGTEIEIPLYNLPTISDEVIVKTNPESVVTDVTVYERKRASFCKFKLSLPPVLSIAAVCRQRVEVFDVSNETRQLVSDTDRRVIVEVPENALITTGELKLQVNKNTEYDALFRRFQIELVTPVVNLSSERLELSEGVDITIPLVSDGENQKDVVVASLTDTEGGISELKCDINDDHTVTVRHSPKGVLAGLVKNDSFTNNNATIKDILQSILDKTNSVQFQIGSKQRREQQKRCKIIVTCSTEDEVDTTVEFWERDGFHFQWCTHSYIGSSGETFAITLSGSTVFCNGQKEERLQFHPRRRNYVVFEVFSNDVLSNVSLSNVDIRPAFSKSKLDNTYVTPLSKIVYTRKIDTGVLGDLPKDDKNDDELHREVSNISDKGSSFRKKKKTTLLRRISRENTKEMKLRIKDEFVYENGRKESEQNDAIETVNDSLDGVGGRDQSKVQINAAETVNDSLDGVGGHDQSKVQINAADTTKVSKQKETTNISTESPQGSLTSLDIEETIKSTRIEKGKANKLTSVFILDSKTNTVVKEGSVVTSDRPVTVRSIVIENLAAFLPVEKTFFSDAYLAVLLDEISENWIVIFILIGIPFDVIDVRMVELHGKCPLHDILLEMLKSWRDESSFHVHKGVPLLLSALRKGGKWDLSISVQQRLKSWHDQGLAIDDPMYNWLKKAYTDSDILIPAEYPRPMSDAFLVMFAPEVQMSHHVTTSLSLAYGEFDSVQDNTAYTNDTVKIMKIFTIYRSKKTDVLEMLEGLIIMCNQLELKRASQCILVSLKGWLKRSACEDEPLKAGIEILLSKQSQPSLKSSTSDSILRQRLDVRAALRVLQTPKHRHRREVRSEYGKPSTSS